MGEGVVEVAGLNGAPAGDAGVMVGRLDDFELRSSLVGFVVLLLFFRACWREGISLWQASPTPPPWPSSPS